MPAVNTRPHHNVSFCTATSRHKVKIIRDGVEHYLGRFDTLEEAITVRDTFLQSIEGTKQERADQRREAEAQWRAFLASPEYHAALAAVDRLMEEQRQQMIESGLPTDIVSNVTAH